jgi:multidrug efflux pump subunit AcrB
MDRHESMIAANHGRTRPIPTTIIAIVAGMLPIACAREAGLGLRASMSVTIIGGQTLCPWLALSVTWKETPSSQISSVGRLEPSDLQP